MLRDEDRIFTNLYGQHEWRLKGALARGDWSNTKELILRGRDWIVDEMKKSGLRGRGGAGFPTGLKWSFMPKTSDRPAYLVVNADESEPGTCKDRDIIRWDPHKLIEGCLVAGVGMGAQAAYIYIRGEFYNEALHLQAAIEEAYAAGLIGKNACGSGYDYDVILHRGAGAYICGEETALIESLEGKRGFPRIKPPYFPAAIGLYGQPTVVNNVETMSNLPWIIANGGAAFAALGAGRSTGTRLFALSGHVRRPGAYELEMVKTTFRDLIYDPSLGGGIRDGNELKAFIPGGVSAPWFGPDRVDLPLGQDEVGDAGSMLGSGSVVVMDSTTCMVRATWRITKFFARESCGQCTPCREGSGWLERVLYRIEHGGGREEDLDLLLDVCDNIAPGLTWPPAMTTICVLGPSIPSSIHSAIEMFRDEFLTHVKEGGCPHG